MANTFVNITNLDFEARKNSLKEFLKNSGEFNDFDFEGSTINMLIQLLAYNSYQDSFLLNMVANEAYIDTAQKRENVVSRAKNLKYVPRSTKAARARLNVTFNPSDNPAVIIIPRGSRFLAKVNNEVFNFTTVQEYSVTNVSGAYEREIEILDGIILTHRFTFNSTTQQTRFTIPNRTVDTSTIRVFVRENPNSTNRVEFTQLEDLTEITSESNIFFLEEDIEEKYVIFFGDGILGRRPANGSIVEIEYLVCDGDRSNGINVFTNNGFTGFNANAIASQYAPSRIETLQRASGGQPRESIEEIRFNAPRAYTRQNRLVTKDDYITFIRERYQDLQSVSFWGGEENVPQIFGRVFMAIKPFNGFIIPETRKQSIINDIKKFNVKTVEPIIVDPTFIYVKPTMTVKYDPFGTTLSADALHSEIAQNIQKYELDVLGKFEQEFRYSNFLRLIDDTSSAILSNETDIEIEKRFVPFINSSLNYRVNFNTELFYPYRGYLGNLKTSGFKTPASTETVFLDDDGLGTLRMYYLVGSERVYINRDMGTIDYGTGRVYITNLIVTEFDGDEIRIQVQPRERDLFPKRNEIVLISSPVINIFNTRLQTITYTGTFDTQGTTTVVFENLATNTVNV